MQNNIKQNFDEEMSFSGFNAFGRSNIDRFHDFEVFGLELGGEFVFFEAEGSLALFEV